MERAATAAVQVSQNLPESAWSDEAEPVLICSKSLRVGGGRGRPGCSEGPLPLTGDCKAASTSRHLGSAAQLLLLGAHFKNSL